MHHFSYVGGVLHAEDVSLARIAAEVGTPFYCYSTATLERHYRVLAPGLRRPRHAHLLRAEGQLQPGRDRHARPSRRRHGRGVGGRAAARARGRRLGRQDHLRRRRQDARGDGLCAEGGHPRLQRRVRARARGPERGGGGPRPHGRASPSASIPTSTPRRTPRSRPARPRTSSACRSRMRRASTPRPPGCRASPSPASTCTSAARSPTWRRSATPSS